MHSAGRMPGWAVRAESRRAGQDYFFFIFCCEPRMKYKIAPKNGKRSTISTHINLLDPVNSLLIISIKAIKGKTKLARTIKIISTCHIPIIANVIISYFLLLGFDIRMLRTKRACTIEELLNRMSMPLVGQVSLNY